MSIKKAALARTLEDAAARFQKLIKLHDTSHLQEVNLHRGQNDPKHLMADAARPSAELSSADVTILSEPHQPDLMPV